MSNTADVSPKDAWRQFARAYVRLVERLERELDRSGVVPLEWYDVLSALAAASDQRLRMGELAGAMLLNRSSLTRLADRLEAAGYVRRAPTPGDRRGAYAVLTDQGAEALRRAEPIYQRTVEESFRAHIDPALKEPLLALFGSIIEHLERDAGAGRAQNAAPAGEPPH